MHNVFIWFALACHSSEPEVVVKKQQASTTDEKSIDKKDVKERMVLNGPQDLKKIVESTPYERSFAVIFSIGEQELANRSWAEIKEFEQVIPKNQTADFYDGIAHGRDWTRLTSAEVEEIFTYVPIGVHERLWNGMVMRRLIVHNGDLTQALSVLKPYQHRFPYQNTDGIRVGIQRLFGDDIPLAIQKAQALPEIYHATVYEELGWRDGQDHQSEVVLHNVESVESEHQCIYLEGAARGKAMAALQQMDIDSVATFSQDLWTAQPLCKPNIRRGVQWAMSLMELPQQEQEQIWIQVQPPLMVTSSIGH